MKRSHRIGAVLAGCLLLAAGAPVARAQAEVPAGTRFLVELRDDLIAKKIKRGKKFEARTLEALRTSDGGVIEAGAKLKGRVGYVENNQMRLDFERIETRRGKAPILATVVGVPHEKGVKKKAGEEGEIKSSGGRAKSAAIGAAIGAGAGAAVGGTTAGTRGAAVGAATGAVAGALIGAASANQDLELRKGARLELQLDRALVFSRR